MPNLSDWMAGACPCSGARTASGTAGLLSISARRRCEQYPSSSGSGEAGRKRDLFPELVWWQLLSAGQSCLLTPLPRPALLHTRSVGLHRVACNTLSKASPDPTLARILPQLAGLRESLPAGVTGNWTSIPSVPDKTAGCYSSKMPVLWNPNVPPPEMLSTYSSFHHTSAEKEQVSHGLWTLSEATGEL